MHQNLVNFLYEIGTLRRMMRAYHLNMHADTETVAEHSHRTAAIAYVLAGLCKADAAKCVMMANFHDMAETRMGDSNWIQKNYIEQDEKRVVEAQLDPLGKIGENLKNLLHEYTERKTLESKVAKDADRLEYAMSLRELAVGGNQEAIRRLKTDKTEQTMYTPEAKRLYALVKRTDPNAWSRRDISQTHLRYKTKK